MIWNILFIFFTPVLIVAGAVVMVVFAPIWTTIAGLLLCLLSMLSLDLGINGRFDKPKRDSDMTRALKDFMKGE